MSAETDSLSEDQLAVLETVYEAFAKVGAWPKYEYVAARIDARSGQELSELLRSMPPGLIGYSNPGPSTPTSL